jgi:DNA-binding response OmpR family regulator
MATIQTSDARDLDFLPSATPSTATIRERVLLIEDDEDAMRLVQYAFEQHGHGRYRLEWAKDLHDGVDLISKGGIDIVLLDLGLPDSAGASSYSWVHQIAPEIPVLVLSGDRHEGTEFAVLARGAYDYLVKSQVSGATLVQTIRAALSVSKRQAPKTVASEPDPPAAEAEDLGIEQGGSRFCPDGF